MSATLQLVPAPAPNDPAWKWEDAALCAQSDPAAWYPAKGDTDTEEAAKAICADCPVQVHCYATAVERGETWGIWGGVNFTPPDAPADEGYDPDAAECINGHLRNEANTYVSPTGLLVCRVCKNAAAVRRHHRKLEVPGAKCGNGHLRTPETTFVDPAGNTRCRECVDANSEKARQRFKRGAA